MGLTQAEKNFLIVLQKGAMHRSHTQHHIHRFQSTPDCPHTSFKRSSQQKKPLLSTMHCPMRLLMPKCRRFKTQFSYVCPSYCSDWILGVICLGNDSITGLFTEDDLRLLQVWAAQAAGILHTSLLLNELKTDSQALRQALETKQPSGNIIGSSAPMLD